ncbi:uncharacterized protein LACBIDRAFT_318701 [Laccaria bicolor S238N-H82]|uniref:Predicted protein n=1 Tax=Laccaria bicolor (strain S238N-H82 / ATCC MYA-4686) TaxID=486041 RepID=B0D6U9_LACBS|nr:uncharacterized protein LACBIDRAFT_318701 [Laccaria bicolor S238N-H82]EDR09538.1 predicted protein [Laccaria bicolor S238N-H82]|eukprot:XP_001879887.1 predicted protein [Laccaria bicolor S238N-H82]
MPPRHASSDSNQSTAATTTTTNDRGGASAAKRSATPDIPPLRLTSPQPVAVAHTTHQPSPRHSAVHAVSTPYVPVCTCRGRKEL